MSAATRFREAKASPLRAPKSASREIFSRRGRAARRKPAYALAAPRKNRCAYDEARQDRQSLQTDPIGYQDDLNLYAYVRNDPINTIDPTGQLKLTLGIGGEITAGLGLGGGADVQVSFPVPGDPAEFDVGWSIYGSLRAGVMVGGGLTGTAEPGSVADTPTLGLEADAIAGNQVLQLGASVPVEFQNGQLVERDRPDATGSGEVGRARSEVGGRAARAGPSTGGVSEGLTGRWTGSAQRVIQAVQQMVSPAEKSPDTSRTTSTESRRERTGPDQ